MFVTAFHTGMSLLSFGFIGDRTGREQYAQGNCECFHFPWQ
jgi:hypothetical protein